VQKNGYSALSIFLVIALSLFYTLNIVQNITLKRQGVLTRNFVGRFNLYLFQVQLWMDSIFIVFLQNIGVCQYNTFL